MLLSELPQEILHLIIGSLANDPSYIFDDDSQSRVELADVCRAQLRTLLDLCLVDKNFAQIARVYLYKFFDSASNESSWFLRTMVQRPNYRDYVRYLRIEPQGAFWDWKRVPNDPNWLAFAYHSILHTAGAVSKCFPPHLTQSSLISDARLEQENTIQWLLINLRNVEALSIAVPGTPDGAEEWAFEIMNHILQYRGTILPCLEYLKISGSPPWLEQYIPCPQMNLAPVRRLLDLATLKRVDLERCAEFDPSNHLWDNLSSLSHSRCHSRKCQIARLVSQCPSLESFYLEGTPSKAFDLSCLSSCEATLEMLDLDVWNLVPVPLTKHAELKVVAISTQSILPSAMAWHELGIPRIMMAIDVAIGASAFIGMLPRSLEHLYLDFTSSLNKEMLENQVNHLIINGLSDLQKLRKVELTWQPSEEMHKALSQAGIVLECFPAEADP